MKAIRLVCAVVLLASAPAGVAGEWGDPCETTVAIVESLAKIVSIARCSYTNFGVQDNSVYLRGSQVLEPGNVRDTCADYGYVSCTAVLSPYNASTTYTSTATFTASQMNLPPFATRTVTGSATTDPPRRPHGIDDSEPCSGSSCSPIIIDVGGNGYRLTSTANGVPFDLRDEGQTRQTSWTERGVENAFLARDLNQNQRIDSGAELFGAATRLQSGARAENGFVALAELDDNGDGVVDARDEG